MYVLGPRVQPDMWAPNDSALVLEGRECVLFKCEPFDTFLAAVGADGGGRVSLKCVSQEKKKVGVELTIRVKPSELLWTLRWVDGGVSLALTFYSPEQSLAAPDLSGERTSSSRLTQRNSNSRRAVLENSPRPVWNLASEAATLVIAEFKRLQKIENLCYLRRNSFLFVFLLKVRAPN